MVQNIKGFEGLRLLQGVVFIVQILLQIYYHEEYDPCTFDNDLALFVLSSDVPEDTATPICIPNRFEEINRNLTAAGDGAAVGMFQSKNH